MFVMSKIITVFAASVSRAWLVMLVLFGATVAHAQTTQEIAKEAFGSTVLLVMEDENGQPLSLGSGFFVRESEVASNLHVVEGAARGYVKIVGQEAKYVIEGITAVDHKRDLVVLKIAGTQERALVLGDSESVQVGESVYAVGNPQGLEGTFSQGIISSIREVEADKLLQITAPISPGSSGGPVLSREGEVVGVSVATFRGGQNLNFAIPSNYLKSLLEEAGSIEPLTKAKAANNQQSILSDLGEKNSKGVIGGQFAWNSPGNQYSGHYTFSIQNRLRESVTDVVCRVIFRDMQGNPLESELVIFKGLVPAGLAKRTSGEVHGSVGRLTEWKGSAVEIRVHHFEIFRPPEPPARSALESFLLR